jgi:hypothetical protein
VLDVFARAVLAPKKSKMANDAQENHDKVQLTP